MVNKKPITLIPIFLLFITITINAQHLKVRNYSAGYRVFEIEVVGNNPITIAPLLKDPVTYQKYLNPYYIMVSMALQVFKGFKIII